MILRSLFNSGEKKSNFSDPQSASAVFIETQKHISAPYAVIFQADHARLAGNLAKGLRETVFGDLPNEVIRATGEHDLGWTDSDQGQMHLLSQVSPRPFPAMSAEETLPSWHASVAHAMSVSPLVDVLVSRHFSLLGASDPGRAQFVKREKKRRCGLEPSLSFAAADLERWTAALGFCDLLSLYLCSGASEPVVFPLAHPADPTAGLAAKTVLWWLDGSPHFSPPVLNAGTHVVLKARTYSGSGTETTPLTLEWTFPAG